MLSAGEAPAAAAAADLAGRFGPVLLAAGPFPFDACTDYYRAEMGPGLQRRFIAFRRPFPPSRLAAAKHFTRRLEEQYAVGGRRRVNLDPGWLDAARVVLATGKDFSHRLYLGRGVYAEVTLLLHRDRVTCLPWTYPDYRTAAAGDFFLALRRLLARRRERAG